LNKLLSSLISLSTEGTTGFLGETGVFFGDTTVGITDGCSTTATDRVLVSGIITRLPQVVDTSSKILSFCKGITRASNAKIPHETKVEVKTSGSCSGYIYASGEKIHPEAKLEVKTSILPVEAKTQEAKLSHEEIVHVKTTHVATFQDTRIGRFTVSPESKPSWTGICLIFVKSASAPLGLIPR